MTGPERVVFDCNVFFQALTSPSGPAARLLELASSHAILLFVSSYAMDEIRDVTSRPRIVAKYRLDAAVVAKFIADINSCATFVDPIPQLFDFGRDPDDAHYVDLALAARARLIVSRDKDLLSLRDLETPEGRDFAIRFPALSILTPPEALKLLDEE